MLARIGVVMAVSSLVLCAPALAQSGAADAQNSVKSEPGGNLSSKLSKSGGVITPSPGVDPGMKVPAPAPHPNSTPVIPPSATGGNTAK